MVRDYSQKTVQELYETIRVNVDEEEQWKVFDFVEDFFMEELEIGDYINDINSFRSGLQKNDHSFLFLWKMYFCIHLRFLAH